MATTTLEDGVEAVYRGDAERLWRAVFAFAGDAEIASDAVAEAFAQVLSRGAAVRDPAAWTWRSAFRIAAGALKSRGGAATAEISDVHVDRYDDPDLVAALQRLPEAQRAAVILFYYADLPVREIAARSVRTASPSGPTSAAAGTGSETCLGMTMSDIRLRFAALDRIPAAGCLARNPAAPRSP